MSKIRHFVLALLPLTVGAYCVFYWTMDHQQLANCYKSLNPFFYNANSWENELFSTATKLAGNWWCLAALLSALSVSVLIWKKRILPLPTIKIKRHQFLDYGLIVLVGSILTLAVNCGTLYTSDEVFSAVNFASLPSFQCISNYPKPNNHLFFNALNGLLFFWSKDLVLTGRLISLACYCMTLCFMWHFLKKWVKKNWLRILVLLVLAVQFPTIGFSFQARGYEMVLLCSCVSLFSFVEYFIQRKNTALLLYIVSNLIGIFTLPSYLYWWAGLIFAAIMLQLFERKIDTLFIKATILGMAGSLILYLPLLTFSGIASISENKYVKGYQVSHWQFLTNINQYHYFEGLFGEWFCVDGNSLIIGMVLLAALILLFLKFNKHQQNKVFSITYISIIFAFLIMSIVMLRLPFYRNLIAHGYLSLLLLLVTSLQLFNSKIKQYILGLILLFFSIFALKTNTTKLPNNLYYYDISGEYDKNQSIQADLDIQKPIYLDYENFYWWYVLRKRYPENRLSIFPNHPRPVEAIQKAGPYQLAE